MNKISTAVFGKFQYQPFLLFFFTFISICFSRGHTFKINFFSGHCDKATSWWTCWTFYHSPNPQYCRNCNPILLIGMTKYFDLWPLFAFPTVNLLGAARTTLVHFVSPQLNKFGSCMSAGTVPMFSFYFISFCKCSPCTEMTSDSGRNNVS